MLVFSEGIKILSLFVLLLFNCGFGSTLETGLSRCCRRRRRRRRRCCRWCCCWSESPHHERKPNTFSKNRNHIAAEETTDELIFFGSSFLRNITFLQKDFIVSSFFPAKGAHCSQTHLFVRFTLKT